MRTNLYPRSTSKDLGSRNRQAQTQAIKQAGSNGILPPVEKRHKKNAFFAKHADRRTDRHGLAGLSTSTPAPEPCRPRSALPGLTVAPCSVPCDGGCACVCLRSARLRASNQAPVSVLSLQLQFQPVLRCAACVQDMALSALCATMLTAYSLHYMASCSSTT